MNQGYSVYNQIDVTTSNPLKIVLMLYDGAITFIERAIECTRSGDVKNKNIHITSASDIIVELNNSLDTEAGGELAQHLRRLYFFMGRHLTHANWHNDVEGMQEVIELLANLREAWQDIYHQPEPLRPPPQRQSLGLRV